MDLLYAAVTAARRAGEVHRRYFQKSFKIRRKSSSFDLLTSADIQAEKVIVSLIKKKFPGHNILAEEHEYKKTDSPYTWIIDPLDGTNNFVCGVPIFCASVALAYNSKVIAGAVYDPMRDELFYAGKNKGAFLNGRRIHVNQVLDFRQALLITGFYYDRGKEMLNTVEAIKRFLLKRIIGLRRFGAAALDLCFVAGGRAAGFWEFQLSPWDFAAGKLLIEEAGGKVTAKGGQEISPFHKTFVVASNGKIHRKMLEVINQK